MKNTESAQGFHILSNLTLDQVAEGQSYNGMHKVADIMKTSSLQTIPTSERRQHRNRQQDTNKGERPGPMRPQVVEDYRQQIQDFTGKGEDSQAKMVFKDIYKNVMDNRIFNNLKQQLNEMIEDERSLISIEEFRKLFVTYFKGEVKASIIYEKLLTCIKVYEQGDELLEQPPQEGEYETKVSI